MSHENNFLSIDATELLDTAHDHVATGNIAIAWAGTILDMTRVNGNIAIRQLFSGSFGREAEHHALRFLREVALYGPPTEWTPTQSAPSASHVRWLALLEFDSLHHHHAEVDPIPSHVVRKLSFQLLLDCAVLGRLSLPPPILGIEHGVDPEGKYLSPTTTRDLISLYDAIQANNDDYILPDEDILRDMVSVHPVLSHTVISALIAGGPASTQHIRDSIASQALELYVQVASMRLDSEDSSEVPLFLYFICEVMREPSNSLASFIERVAAIVIEQEQLSISPSELRKSVYNALTVPTVANMFHDAEKKYRLKRGPSEPVFTACKDWMIRNNMSLQPNLPDSASNEEFVEWWFNYKCGACDQSTSHPDALLWRVLVQELIPQEQHFMDFIMTEVIRRLTLDSSCWSDAIVLTGPFATLRPLIVILMWPLLNGAFFKKCQLIYWMWEGVSDRRGDDSHVKCVERLAYFLRLSWWISSLNDGNRLARANTVLDMLENNTSLLDILPGDDLLHHTNEALTWISNRPAYSQRERRAVDHEANITRATIALMRISTVIDTEKEDEAVTSLITSISDEKIQVDTIHDGLSLIFKTADTSIAAIEAVLHTCDKCLAQCKCEDDELIDRVREGIWRVSILDGLGIDGCPLSQLLASPQSLLNACLLTDDFARAQDVISFFKSGTCWGKCDAAMSVDDVAIAKTMNRMSSELKQGSTAIEVDQDYDADQKMSLYIDLASCHATTAEQCHILLGKAEKLSGSVQLKEFVARLRSLLDAYGRTEPLNTLIGKGGFGALRNPKNTVHFPSESGEDCSLDDRGQALRERILMLQRRQAAVDSLMVKDSPCSRSYVIDLITQLDSPDIPMDHLSRFLQYLVRVGDVLATDSYDYLSTLSRTPTQIISSLVFEARDYTTAENVASACGISLANVLSSSLCTVDSPIDLDILSYLSSFSMPLACMTAMIRAPAIAAEEAGVLPVMTHVAFHDVIDFALTRSADDHDLNLWVRARAVVTYDFVKYFLDGRLGPPLDPRARFRTDEEDDLECATAASSLVAETTDFRGTMTPPRTPSPAIHSASLIERGVMTEPRPRTGHFFDDIDGRPPLAPRRDSEYEEWQEEGSLLTRAWRRSKQLVRQVSNGALEEEPSSRSPEPVNPVRRYLPSTVAHVDTAKAALDVLIGKSLDQAVNADVAQVFYSHAVDFIASKGDLSGAISLADRVLDEGASDELLQARIHSVTDSQTPGDETVAGLWRLVQRLRDPSQSAWLALHLYEHWDVHACVSVFESCVHRLTDSPVLGRIKTILTDMRLFRDVMETDSSSWPSWPGLEVTLRTTPESVVRHLVETGAFRLAQRVVDQFNVDGLQDFIDQGILLEALSSDDGSALATLHRVIGDDLDKATSLGDAIYERLDNAHARLLLVEFLLRRSESRTLLLRRMALSMLLHLPDAYHESLMHLAVAGQPILMIETLLLGNKLDLVTELLSIEHTEIMNDCDRVLAEYAARAIGLSPGDVVARDDSTELILTGQPVQDDVIRSQYSSDPDLYKSKRLIDMLHSRVAAGRAATAIVFMLLGEWESDSHLKLVSDHNMLISVLHQLLLHAKMHFNLAQDEADQPASNETQSPSWIEKEARLTLFVSGSSSAAGAEGISICDTLISQVDLLDDLEQVGGMKSSLSISDFFNPIKIRRLRDKLVLDDRYDLALQFATQCGVEPEPVWAQWGLAALKLCLFEEARARFKYCLIPTTQGEGQVQRSTSWMDGLSDMSMSAEGLSTVSFARRIVGVGQSGGGWGLSDSVRLVDEIVAALETVPATGFESLRAEYDVLRQELASRRARGEGSEDEDGGLNIDSYLRALDVPEHRRVVDPTPTTNVSDDEKVERGIAEAMAGSIDDKSSKPDPLPAFCPWTPSLHSDRLRECYTYLRDFGLAHQLAHFCSRHGLLAMVTDLVVASPPLLTQQSFIDDVLSPILQRGTDGLTSLLAAIRQRDRSLGMFSSFLITACKHLNNAGRFEWLRQVQLFMGDHARAGMACIRLYLASSSLGERKSRITEAHDHLIHAMTNPSKPRVGSQLSATEVGKYFGLVQLQIEVDRFFLDGDEFYSLFSTQKRRSAIAEELMVRGNFDVAFHVIQFFRLPAVGIYAATAMRLAESRQHAQVNELLRTIQGTVTDEDWDEIVGAAITACATKAKTAGNALISRLFSDRARVRALIQLKKYKAAYLTAVRVGSLDDVRIVLAQTRSVDKGVANLCVRYLEQEQTKLEQDMVDI